VSAETFQTDATPTGRAQYMTDVKVWTSLAAARDPTQLQWDPVKHTFEVPEFTEPEPEPEPYEEQKEEEPEKEEKEEEPPEQDKEKMSKEKPKKKKPPKKTKKKPLPRGSLKIVYAKPRTLKKS